MSICHFIVAFSIVKEYNVACLIFICLFLAIYQTASAPVTWCYVAETTTDVGLGVAIQSLHTVVLIETLTSVPLIDAFGAQNIFYIFGAACIGGGIFVYFFVAESFGLSEKEKKCLYYPGEQYGRKLLPGEDTFAQFSSPVMYEKVDDERTYASY